MGKQSLGAFLARLQQDECLRKQPEAKLGSVGAGVPAARPAQFAQHKG